MARACGASVEMDSEIGVSPNHEHFGIYRVKLIQPTELF
jgi:hypothetical protein